MKPHPHIAFPGRPIALLGACLVGLVALSWFRLWYVGTPNLDGLPIDLPWEIARRTAMFALFAGAGWAFVKLMAHEIDSAWMPRLLAASLLLQLVLLFCLPLTSNDIFSNLAYGKMALAGLDIDRLGVAALPPDDAFRHMVTARWMQTPMVYGPVIGWINRWVTMPDSLWGSIAAYKAAALALSALLTLIVFAFSRRFVEAPAQGRSFVLAALNPVFLWELGAQAHNDAVMLIGIAGFLFFAASDKMLRALGCLIFAVVAKLAALPVLGLSLCYTWFRARTQFLLACAALAVGAIAVVAVFHDKLATILVVPQSQGVDMTRLTNSPLFLIATLLEPAGVQIQALGYRAFWIAAMLVMALLGLGLAWRCRSRENLVDASLLFLTLFGLIASPMYQPWYATWILPFAVASRDEGLRRFVVWYSVISVARYAIQNSLVGSVINLGILILFLVMGWPRMLAILKNQTAVAEGRA